MGRAQRIVIAWCCAMLCAAGFGGAQDVGVTLIESTGVGTVHGLPTHVDFWIHRELEGVTVTEAVARAEKLEAELTAALAAEELARAAVEVAAPAVSDLTKHWAVSSAQVRFALARHTDHARAAEEFGTLCDKMVKVAEVLKGTLRGPFLQTEERDALLKQAVALATENAYPAAEAAADLLKSTFYSVDSVRIEAIHWNQTPESEAPEPNLRRVACTAEVRVVYAVTPK